MAKKIPRRKVVLGTISGATAGLAGCSRLRNRLSSQGGDRDTPNPDSTNKPTEAESTPSESESNDSMSHSRMVLPVSKRPNMTQSVTKEEDATYVTIENNTGVKHEYGWMMDWEGVKSIEVANIPANGSGTYLMPWVPEGEVLVYSFAADWYPLNLDEATELAEREGVMAESKGDKFVLPAPDDISGNVRSSAFKEGAFGDNPKVAPPFNHIDKAPFSEQSFDLKDVSLQEDGTHIIPFDAVEKHYFSNFVYALNYTTVNKEYNKYAATFPLPKFDANITSAKLTDDGSAARIEELSCDISYDGPLPTQKVSVRLDYYPADSNLTYLNKEVELSKGNNTFKFTDLGSKKYGVNKFTFPVKTPPVLTIHAGIPVASTELSVEEHL